MVKHRVGDEANSSSSSFVIDKENCNNWIGIDRLDEILHSLVKIENELGNDLKIDDVLWTHSSGERIEIKSVDDNSIPYWIMEFIEYRLGGKITHHG